MEDDIQNIERGASVTFERGEFTAIGEVASYLGDGLYLVRDEETDVETEIREEDLSVMEEA